MARRRTFSAEFKREAVGLVRSSNQPASQVARDLGINVNVLSRWCREAQADGPKAFPGQTKTGTDLFKRHVKATRSWMMPRMGRVMLPNYRTRKRGQIEVPPIPRTQTAKTGTQKRGQIYLTTPKSHKEPDHAETRNGDRFI